MIIPHQKIINALNVHAQKAGVKLFFVGGIVRDLILNVPVSDIDIVVEGGAIEFCKSYADSDEAEIISTHPDFGTCKMRVCGIEIDFASTRTEFYPKSGSLPVVQNIGCELKQDVSRRDFTINSIALDLVSGEIIDYLGGVEDLKNRKLKVTYKNSFFDDPTRILRGLDFALRFGLELDIEAQKEFFSNLPNRDGLSISRVDLTLKKILARPEAYKKIIEEKMYKIFQDEAPEIPSEKLEENIKLFGADSVLTRFMAIKNELPPKGHLETNFEIYNFFKSFSPEELALNGSPEAVKFHQELRDTSVCLSGDEILELGFSQGKIIGEIKEEILKIKLNDPKNAPKNKQDEIQFIGKIRSKQAVNYKK